MSTTPADAVSHGSAPMTVLAERARRCLPAESWAFLAATAGEGRTAVAGAEAWDRQRLRPRYLHDRDPGAVSVTTSATLFGQSVAAPIVVAPVGLQRLFHMEAEAATAAGATAARCPMVVSWSSSLAAGEVRERVPGALLWQQLYPSRDENAYADVVAGAREAGCQALVLTIDLPVLDDRPTFGPHVRTAARRLRRFTGLDGTQADRAAGLRPATTADVTALAATGLPVLVKGVLHPRDAEFAVEAGAAGLIVSDHGGRQLDGAVPSPIALPEIADAVGGAAAVLVDGAVRRGVDVVTARALGADAVLVGRPIMWGLATGGAAGVRSVLDRLIIEVERALALCGATSIDEIGPDVIHRSPDSVAVRDGC